MSALRNRSRRALFLCYHSIAAEGPEWLSVDPDTLERQLATLSARGYVTGGRPELAALTRGERFDRRLCFLTFDDGFLDNHREALPRLRERGFKAWVFVLPPLLDQGAALDWPEVRAECERFPATMRSLTWPLVEELAEAGMEIGSHGLSHAHLPELDEDALTEELTASRAALKERLGRCDALSYPFGEWDERVRRAAERAGYSFAFSIPHGAQSTTTELSIPRIPVDRRDTPWRFRLKTSATGRRVQLSPLRAGLGRLRPWRLVRTA